MFVLGPLTDRHAEGLATAFPNLIHLSLWHASLVPSFHNPFQVTDTGFAALLDGCPALQRLLFINAFGLCLPSMKRLLQSRIKSGIVDGFRGKHAMRGDGPATMAELHLKKPDLHVI